MDPQSVRYYFDDVIMAFMINNTTDTCNTRYILIRLLEIHVQFKKSELTVHLFVNTLCLDTRQLGSVFKIQSSEIIVEFPWNNSFNSS